jgi:hypothetical protein
MRGWTEEGLVKAWRALSDRLDGEAWRFVRLTELGSVEVEAARHFPGSREAVLLALPALERVDLGVLPKGRGFEVSVVHDDDAFPDRFVIALARESEGNPDIFSVVAVDVIRLVEECQLETPTDILHRFLSRVCDWQTFMERSHRLLSADRQVGLLGELTLLSALVRSELGASALRSWKGPLRAAVDFKLGDTGIEVKSTAKRGPFVAQISSLEQLDNDCATMFLCGLRFEEHEDGASLPEVVVELREKFHEAGTVRGFDALLMTAGYLDEHAESYGRRLTLADAKVFWVADDFPRLTKAMMPAAVRGASYALDIDAITTRPLGLSQFVSSLDLTLHEP